FADGRGLAAALVMGAAGIQMGTRFLIAEECGVHPNVKQRLLTAVDTDSVVTGLVSGHGVRGIRNGFTDKYLAMERRCAPQSELDKLATGTNRLAAIEGDIEHGAVLAGQSLLPLQRIEPADVIVKAIMSEAYKVLANAQKLLK
ncbi:MAG: Nitronate monooxygenase, partial [Sporomusa sp.]|nr:Nitronate monooxygenase [Sporomusa sp.]